MLSVNLINSLSGILKKLETYSKVYLIKDGSFVFPLIGMGAKKGLSVSNNKRFKGRDFIVSLKSFAFLKVIIPDKEI